MAKVQINTHINKDLLDAFKETCEKNNIPMNTCLEIFMKDFYEGKIKLTIGNTTTMRIVEGGNDEK